MTDDLRERIAAAILARLMQPTGPIPSEYDLADAALAVPNPELEQLRAEVARLRAGESAEPPAPHTTLTPAQWLRRLHDAPAEERLRVIEVLLGEVDRGSRCFQLNHEGVIEDLQAELTTARENRGPEIHGEPRTDPTPTRDTRPAP